MDLGTISAKFSSGMYKSRDEFAADVRQIVTNATIYNAPGSPMHQAARAFEEVFEKRKCSHTSPRRRLIFASLVGHRAYTEEKHGIVYGQFKRGYSR